MFSRNERHYLATASSTKLFQVKMLLPTTHKQICPFCCQPARLCTSLLLQGFPFYLLWRHSLMALNIFVLCDNEICEITLHPSAQKDWLREKYAIYNEGIKGNILTSFKIQTLSAENLPVFLILSSRSKFIIAGFPEPGYFRKSTWNNKTLSLELSKKTY